MREEVLKKNLRLQLERRLEVLREDLRRVEWHASVQVLREAIRQTEGELQRLKKEIDNGDVLF